MWISYLTIYAYSVYPFKSLFSVDLILVKDEPGLSEKSPVDYMLLLLLLSLNDCNNQTYVDLFRHYIWTIVFFLCQIVLCTQDPVREDGWWVYLTLSQKNDFDVLILQMGINRVSKHSSRIKPEGVLIWDSVPKFIFIKQSLNFLYHYLLTSSLCSFVHNFCCNSVNDGVCLTDPEFRSPLSEPPSHSVEEVSMGWTLHSHATEDSQKPTPVIKES